MYQGEINTASRYLTLRTPPIFTTEDVKMRLTIMVADRLVKQNFVYKLFSVMFIFGTSSFLSSAFIHACLGGVS